MHTSRKAAMVAVRDNHRTPWTRATGRERAVEVRGLGEGDVLRMLVDLGGDVTYVIALREGMNSLLLDPLPREWVRYLLDKHTTGISESTSAEVILG